MEATALSVGKSVLDGALGFAKSALAEEVALQLGIQRDHAFIRDELEMMRAFLMAAHEEQDDHTVTKTWVKQVRDVAYDSEDFLRDFAIRLGKPSWWRLPSTLLDRHRMATRMKELRAKVEDVSQRNVRYQLIRSSSSKPAPSTTATEQSNNLVSAVMSGTEEVMRQRNKAKMDLIGLIRNRVNDDLRVIAIWGTGNFLGETSVVRMAYDYLKRSNKFKCVALISITRPFNKVEFVQNIVRQLCVHSLRGTAEPEANGLWEMGTIQDGDLLVGALRHYMNDKSFLIVVSNLSTKEEWDQINECFPINKKGSRLIVCTEKVELAIRLCVQKEYEMPEHKQIFTDPTLFAFYEKGSQDQICSMETGPSSSEITNNGSVNEKKFTRTETISYAFKESQLIGRANEKLSIINLVSENISTKDFQVISVWGMGGLGKTTLVKQVYQSEKLCNMFEKRACVTVKRPFNRDELLDTLVTQLTGGDKGKATNEPSLTGILERKTYLIVLDDLYSIEEWDAINKYFPREEATRGRIIITTRVKSIADYCSKNAKYTWQLGILGEEDACNLFTEKVFGKITDLDEQYPELTEVAKMILKKCNGLPLAIVNVAGFLSKQPKTLIEWRKLNEHIGVEMEMNQELGKINGILIKSYDGLPYHLKSCFLYLSIFPEDQEISRRRLIRRWAAEGYSRQIRGKLAEEISDSYFMELIDRSIILPSKTSIFSRKGIDSCQLHDLMRDISISKSAEENLVFRLEEGCSSNTQEIVRHLSISSNWTGDRSEFESAVDLSHLRSLTVFGEWRSFYISKKMRLLRVLDLENTSGLVDHHLERIGSLVHLKYISLRGCDEIYHLPDSWGNLLQLETLDIKDTRICVLPQTIVNLRKLQHLFGGDLGPIIFDMGGRIKSYKRSELCLTSCCAPKYLKECEDLNGDPNMHDVCAFWCHVVFPALASRRFDRNCIVLPKGVRKLKNLRTLGLVNIAGGKTILREIRSLTQLRKLAVRGVYKKNHQEFCSAVAALSRLESLSVGSTWGLSLHGLLDDVSTPPSNLQSLKLIGELVKLPEWIGGLQNLVKLALWGTKLAEVDSTMKALGKLPNLAILRLLLDPFNFHQVEVHITFYGEVPFRSLMVLELYLIRGLSSVKFQEEAAPHLELLRFDGRTESPANLFSGLATLKNLKEFQLKEFLQDGYTYNFEKDVQTQLNNNPNRPIFKKLN